MRGGARSGRLARKSPVAVVPQLASGRSALAREWGTLALDMVSLLSCIDFARVRFR